MSTKNLVITIILICPPVVALYCWEANLQQQQEQRNKLLDQHMNSSNPSDVLSAIML